MSDFTMQCPIPLSQYKHVQLAHGSGGKLMHQLIDEMFVRIFSQNTLDECHDSATIEFPCNRIAFTTDSYVVNPVIFPGGDIGTLAVNGTVNDLAMAGARPYCLSIGFILEEGFPLETLWKICQSIHTTAQTARVKIVTGDTKVVDKGKGDGIFINTSGIGILEHHQNIMPTNIQEGDAIIINGDLARHGMAIMAVREGLEFESSIESDTASLANSVQALLDEGIEIHCMRDLTRGGLSSALNELAQASKHCFEIDESKISVREDVSSACEILGLDPLYVANEGRFVLFVPEKFQSRTLEVLKRFEINHDAQCIGQVGEQTQSIVFLKSKIGARRILDMLSGEQLPRIC